MDDTRARAEEDIALDSSRLRSSARLGSAASTAAAVTATAAAVATTTTSTTSSAAAATCRVARRKRKKRRRQRLAASNDDVPGDAVVVASRSATTSSNNAVVAEGTTATAVDDAADTAVALEPDADAVAADAATAETDPLAVRVDKLRSRLLGEQHTAASGEAQQLRVGGSGSRAAASSVGTAGVTLLNRRAGKRSPRRCNAAGGRRNATTMDLQRLINEVHARPAIWDQKNVNYHNRDVILKMWREIARACEVSTDVAKSKWKHLRDNFRNELKKTYRSKCDAVGTEHDSKWVWFKSLFFLRDQMNSRVIGCGHSPQNCVNAVGMRSSPDGTQIEPQIDILEGHEETQFDDLDGDSCQSLLSNDDGLHQVMPPPKMNKIIGRKRALMDNDYGMEMDRKRYESLQKRLAIGPEDEDDTYHFLMSVRNPLRSLPLDRQMFVRLKIQELVYNEINSQNQQQQQQQQQTTNRGVYDVSSQGQDVKPPRTGNGGNGVVADDVVNDMSNPASLLQNCTPEGSGDDAFFG